MRHIVAIFAFSALCITFTSCDSGITKQSLPDGGMLVLEGSQAKGIKKIYSRDGALTACIEIKDSVPNGKCIYYYSNGKAKSMVNAINGKPNGLEISYYISGKKAKEITFKDGRRNGIYRQFYPSGKLKSEQTFKMSKSLGDLKEYTEDGSVIPLAKLDITINNQLKTTGKYNIEARLNPMVNLYRLYIKYPIVSDKQPYKKIKVTKGVGTFDLYKMQLVEKREMEVMAVYKTKFDNECKVSQVITII